MLPEFKNKKETAVMRYGAAPDFCFKLRKHSSDLLASIWLGRHTCSIPSLTVAQQPMIYTWFLFNNPRRDGGINLEMIH